MRARECWKERESFTHHNFPFFSSDAFFLRQFWLVLFPFKNNRRDKISFPTRTQFSLVPFTWKAAQKNIPIILSCVLKFCQFHLFQTGNVAEEDTFILKKGNSFSNYKKKITVINGSPNYNGTHGYHSPSKIVAL